jgi:hypothetical protein
MRAVEGQAVRALSIQVQPERSQGLDLDRLVEVCTEIAAMQDLVIHHGFNRGVDKSPYLNFTFGTPRATSLWRVIQARLYEDAELGPHLRAASMAMCSSAEGWADYLLLYHFDPDVKLDPGTNLSD